MNQVSDSKASTSILDLRRARARAQQASVVAAQAPLAVLACPGAGKTRTIVDRHCASPRGQPTGRAIVSFTKVAAAQIRKRAHELGRSDLLEHPHVITTLDGFFWRFLVRPFLPGPADGSLRIFSRLESWRYAPRELRQFEFFPDPGDRSRRVTFDLAEFQFRYTYGGPAPAASLSGLERVERGRKNLTDGQIAAVCRLAAQRRTELANNFGLFTGEETRRAAHTFLDAHADQLACMLPRRFAELIVDEAQDCSDTDVQILLRISELGVPLIVLADPDQAIYGFRSQGQPAVTRLLAGASTIEMSGNWRSSSVICALAATMRADPARRVPDTALADHHDAGLPVHLISHGDGAELSTFHSLASAARMPSAQRLILAHATATLPGVGVGARRPPPNPSTALVWAVGILRQADADQRTRVLAERTVEAAILRCWLPDADRTPSADLRETYGIDRWHLRRLAVQTLEHLPDVSMPMAAWCAAAREVLSARQPVAAISKPRGITLATPQGTGNRTAATLAGLAKIAAGRGETRADTVHQVKGEEADAVLVLLPDDDRTTRLLSHWTQGEVPLPGAQPGQSEGDTAEALRVLYVAVTRAHRLLALALPGRHIPAVAKYLLRLGVTIETS